MKTKLTKQLLDLFDGANNNDVNIMSRALDECPEILNKQYPATGMTALSIAAVNGNYTSLHFLLVTKKADPWIADKTEQLPLDYARAIGHEPCRQLLLESMYPELDDKSSAPSPK